MASEIDIEKANEIDFSIENFEKLIDFYEKLCGYKSIISFDDILYGIVVNKPYLREQFNR